MVRTQVSLEITEASVRAAEVTRERVPRLVTAGEVPLAAGAAKDSEILDRDAVAMALQRLWSEARIQSRDVVLGVGNRRILVREHTTKLRDPARIRQALPFEVQDRLPVPADQAVLDFVPTGEDDEGVHGLLVAAVAEHMDALVETLTLAKLRTTAVDLTSFGLARAMRLLAPAGSTALLLCVGEHTSHVVIAVDGIPQFTRVIPIDLVAPADPEGEEGSAEAGPSALVVPLAGPVAPSSPLSRAALRRGRATPADEAPLTPFLQSALIDLVNRVRATIAFYLDRPGARPIDATWVAGAHATHSRLRGAIEQITETTVTVVGIDDLVHVGDDLGFADDLSARLVSTIALTAGDAR